jgi:hypothetical protein
MHLSLKRLRAAFFALGIVLLGALYLLVSSALARLDRQRKLRHEVVAERIFDELERELTAHFLVESERPSQAYDAQVTTPEAWAPFVVGYFTVADGYRVVARDKLPGPRVVRLEQALARVWPAPSHVVPPAPSAAALPDDTQAAALDKNAAAAPVQSSPEVLRRLNRAREEGQQQRLAPSNKKQLSKPSRQDAYGDDPFMGL